MDSWSYYGGFTVFSTQPSQASTGPDWIYYGGFHSWSTGVSVQPSTGPNWVYYGGFHVWGPSGNIVVTSSGGPVTPRGGQFDRGGVYSLRDRNRLRSPGVARYYY